jgi:hypothetical protein
MIDDEPEITMALLGAPAPTAITRAYVAPPASVPSGP